MFTASRIACSRCRSPPGTTCWSHIPDAPRARAPPRSCSLNRTCACPPRTMASSEIGPDRDRCAVGQHARDRAARALAERARLAAVARARVVYEEDAPERQEPPEPADLRARPRRELGVAAPVEKRRVDDRWLVGVNDGRVQPRRSAGALHELPGPAGGCRCAGRAG